MCSSKKNVLILLPDSLKDAMGGMGEQCRQVLKHWKNKNIDFSIIGAQWQENEIGDNYTYFKVEVLPLPILNVDALNQVFLNQTAIVSTCFKNNIKPDIIHAFDWSTFYAGSYLAGLFKVPLVVTVQLSIDKLADVTYLEENVLQKSALHTSRGIEMQGLLNATRIIQVSKAYADKFPEFLRSKTHILENGITLDDWIPKSDFAFPGIPSNKKLIYIGRYAAMKNIAALLEAKIPDNVDLMFVGKPSGGDSGLFDRMIVATKTKNKFYLGPLYNQTKVDCLCSADAVIIPSIHEPFGIVALEALASKNILLSSFVDGMSDFLNKDCAIDCGTTPDSISSAVTKWLKLTPQEICNYQNTGISVCQKFGWDGISKRLSDIYCSIL